MKRFYIKSDFSKNTLILVSGTIVAQAIPLALYPFLRHIYTPEDFGAMTAFKTVIFQFIGLLLIN